VPDVTNINSVLKPELNWASRLGASCLPSVSFLGTSLPAAGPVTAPALTRVRGKVAVMVPQAQKVAVTAQLDDQTNVHNYMTGVTAVGEGASGPPRDRGPV
jgi:hypothetical protein